MLVSLDHNTFILFQNNLDVVFFILREVIEFKVNSIIDSVKNSKSKDVFGLDSLLPVEVCSRCTNSCHKTQLTRITVD